MKKKNRLCFLSILIFVSIVLSLGSLEKKRNTISGAHVKFTINRLFLFIIALENFKDDVGQYPSTKEGLNALMSSTRQGWKGPYVAQQKWSTVKDIRQDAWGTKYIYIYPAKYNSDGFYDLYSCGKNLRDDLGQKDDVTSWKEEDEAFYSKDRGLFVEFLSKWFNFIIILLFLAIVLISCSKSRKV
jgi:general secretion pathway protein G